MARWLGHYPKMAKTKVAPNANIGPNIAALMQHKPELGSQPLLAVKTGIGQTTIGRIVRSEVNTGAEKLQKIAAVFGISVDALYIDQRRFLDALMKGELPQAAPAVPSSIHDLVSRFNDAVQALSPERLEELQGLMDLYLKKPAVYRHFTSDIERVLSGEMPLRTGTRDR